jgi:hypothetical protein
MNAVVVYESMYGNTHLVADAVAGGLREGSIDEVAVVPVEDASWKLVADADLVVVGGPTHAHGMSRASTRRAAVDAAAKEGSDLSLDADAEGPGLRDWFETLGPLTSVAAFDTRMKAPAALSGRASKGIARRLREHGGTLVVEPESFLVTKENHLVDDEADHARTWGSRLAEAMAAYRSATSGRCVIAADDAFGAESRGHLHQPGPRRNGR